MGAQKLIGKKVRYTCGLGVYMGKIVEIVMADSSNSLVCCRLDGFSGHQGPGNKYPTDNHWNIYTNDPGLEIFKSAFNSLLRD